MEARDLRMHLTYQLRKVREIMTIFSRKINPLKKSENLVHQIDELNHLIILLDDINTEMNRHENTEICLTTKLNSDRTMITLQRDQIKERFDVHEMLS